MSSVSTTSDINNISLRWDLVKWRSLFTYFIRIDLLPVVQNCPVSTIPHKQRKCEMGFGEITVLIYIFHQNRPFTHCVKLSSISTIPHKQRTCEMGFGEITVLIHIFQHNRPSTRCADCPPFPLFHINSVRVRWDSVK